MPNDEFGLDHAFYEGVRPLLKTPGAGPAADPVLPMAFRKGEVSLELFTTIATLGTPRDVTLDEVRIECFFPMDDQTEAICRAWAKAGQARLERLFRVQFGDLSLVGQSARGGIDDARDLLPQRLQLLRREEIGNHQPAFAVEMSDLRSG